MKTYNITVLEIRDLLNRMIDDGHAGLPLVVTVGDLEDNYVVPISSIGIGSMQVYASGFATIPKDGEGTIVANIGTPGMIPTNFWLTEIG